MDEAGLGPHFFLQGSQKGDDVMARGFLNGQDALHVDVRLVADRLHGFRRDAPQLGPGLAHGHFHREPSPITVFQGPDPTHLRPGVAFDHGFPFRNLALEIAARRWSIYHLNACLRRAKLASSHYAARIRAANFPEKAAQSAVAAATVLVSYCKNFERSYALNFR